MREPSPSAKVILEQLGSAQAEPARIAYRWGLRDVPAAFFALGLILAPALASYIETTAAPEADSRSSEIAGRSVAEYSEPDCRPLQWIRHCADTRGCSHACVDAAIGKGQ